MLARYIFFLFLPLSGVAQLTHRDLLQKNCPPTQLQRVLVTQQDFNPFPKTPGEWKKLLPDSIIQYLIRNGETALRENFPNIPATTTLDFSRNGNRTRYETISFGKRNRLWDLVRLQKSWTKIRNQNPLTTIAVTPANNQLVFPIPQGERDANPNIVQNPGY